VSSLFAFKEIYKFALTPAHHPPPKKTPKKTNFIAFQLENLLGDRMDNFKKLLKNENL